MKKLIYTLCCVSLFGAGLSSCADDAAEIVPTQTASQAADDSSEDPSKTKKL